MWYSFENIDKKQKLFNWIVTARGTGKTIAMKDRIVKRGIKGHKSLYVRRSKVECEAKQMSDFFVKMQKIGYHNEYDLKYDNGKFFCNDKVIGYVTPLSTSVNVRSQDFVGVTDIYFEEFVLHEDKSHKYLENEVEIFLELYNTVSRNTDIRCWFIGNNVDVFNPYFLYFNLKPPITGIKVWGEHAIDFYTNKNYEEKVLSTKFGKIIAGTKYADYAVRNKPLSTQDQFISKIPPGVRPLFNVIYYGDIYGVYAGHDNFCYVGNNKNNANLIVSFEPKDHSTNTINYKGFRGCFEYGFYIQSLKHNKIYYASEKAEQIGRLINRKLYFM